MLLFLSAFVLILLSGYGVFAPMMIRDIIGNGDMYVYPDVVSLELKSNVTDVYFKGEFFITRNNIDAQIHETFYRIYYKNRPALGLTLSNMDTYTNKRSDLDFHTQLVVFDAKLINELIYDALHGINADVIMQGYMGVSVFHVPTYNKVFVERYLLPANTNIQTQLQQLVDGTFPHGSVDPTLKQYPKPVIPVLETPTIHSITLYRASNEIGLNVHFEWVNHFISIFVKEFKLPLMLNNVTIGGIYLQDLNMYTSKTVNERVKFGLFLETGPLVKNAVEQTFTTLIQNLTMDIGINGPLSVISKETVTWLKEGTQALKVNIHLDFPSLFKRLPISLPMVPKAMLNINEMHLFLVLKTIHKSVDISLSLELPNSFPKLPEIKSLIGFGLTINYIKDLINIKLGKLHVLSNKVKLSTNIEFYNQPAAMHSLIQQFIGNTNTNDEFHFHNLNFYPSCPTCQTFDKLDLHVKPPTINFNQYLKFGSSILSDTNLGLKLTKLSINQVDHTFQISVDFELGISLPVDVFIGYLSAKLQLNNKNALTVTIKDLILNNKSKSHHLSLELQIHDNPSYSTVIQQILNKVELKDTLTLSSIKLGQSPTDYSTLFDQIDISVLISKLLKIKLPPLPKLDLDLHHVLTPTNIGVAIDNVIELSLSSLFKSPLPFPIYLHLEPISIIINSIHINLKSITLSNKLDLGLQISFTNGDLTPFLNDIIHNNQFKGDVSLTLNKIKLLSNVHVDMQLPALDTSKMTELVDTSQLHLSDPFSNLNPNAISVNHHESTINTHIDLNINIHVPLALYISKLQVMLRLNKNPFLQITTNTIKITPNNNHIKLNIDLLFINCPNCDINTVLSDLLNNHLINLIIGIQHLKLGNIHQLSSLVIDIPINKPAPSLSIPKSPSIDPKSIKIHDLMIIANDHLIQITTSISNPISFPVDIHLQHIQFNLLLNNNQFIHVVIDQLNIKNKINLKMSLRVSDIPNDVNQLFKYITTTDTDAPSIGISDIVLDQINLLQPVSVHILLNSLVPSHSIDINDMVSTALNNKGPSPLSNVVIKQLDVVKLHESTLSLVVELKTPFSYLIKLPLSVSLQLNNNLLVDLNLNIDHNNHHCTVDVNVVVHDEPTVFHDLSSILSLVINNRDLSGVATISNLQIANIHAFQAIGIPIPLSLIHVSKSPSIAIPKLNSVAVVSNKQMIEIDVNIQFKLPVDLISVELGLFDQRLIQVEVRKIDHGVHIAIIVDNGYSKVSELRDTITNALQHHKLQLLASISKLRISHHKLGQFHLNNEIRLDIHRELVVPSIAPPAVTLNALNTVELTDTTIHVNADINVKLPLAVSVSIPFIKIHAGLVNDMVSVVVKDLVLQNNKLSLDLELGFFNDQNTVLATELNKLLSLKETSIHISHVILNELTLLNELNLNIPLRLKSNPLDHLDAIVKDIKLPILPSIKVHDIMVNMAEDTSLTTNLNLEIHTKLKLNLPKIQFGLRMNKQSFVLVKLQPLIINKNEKLQIGANLLFLKHVTFPIKFDDLLVGIEGLEIGNIQLFNKIKLDVKLPHNLKLPELPKVQLPQLQPVINELAINNNDNVAVHFKLQLENIFIHIPYIRIIVGVKESSLDVTIGILMNDGHMDVSIATIGDANNNEMLRISYLIDQLTNNKHPKLSLFLDSLAFGINKDDQVDYKIQQILPLPAMKIPKLDIKLPTVELNKITNVNAQLDARISVKAQIQVHTSIPITANLHNIELQVQMLDQPSVYIQLQQLSLEDNGSVTVSITLEPKNVNTELQSRISDLVTALTNNHKLPDLQIALYGVKLPFFNLLTVSTIPVTLPTSIKSPPMPKLQLPVIKLNSATVNQIGLNKLNILGELALEYKELTITLNINKMGLVLDLMNNPLASISINGAVIDDQGQGNVDIVTEFKNGCINDINHILSELLSHQELVEFVHGGVKLQQNILDKVRVKVFIKDLIKKKETADTNEKKELIKSVNGNVVQQGIYANILLDLEDLIKTVTVNIEQIRTKVFKQEANIFEIDVTPNKLPNVEILIKPIFPELSTQMSQIYRRMKLGLDIASDISIRGIYIHEFDILNGLAVNKLPKVTYIEGVLACRMHTLNPIKLIKDPGIGTDVLFKMTTLPFEVDFDFGELYFMVLDYLHFDADLLSYSHSMQLEREHINDLKYPVDVPAIGGYNKTDYKMNCIHKDHVKYYNVNVGLLFFIRWVSNPLGAVKGLLQIKRRKLLRDFKIHYQGEEIKWFGKLFVETDVYVHVHFDKIPDFPKNPRPDR